ncbi:MAG TPA: hypothetical protein VIM25_11885 [Candidatus Limnocylindrales bacterium]
MQVAPEADRRAVAQATTGDELGTVAGLRGEVPAEPRLALGEERVHMTLQIRHARPAAPPGDGHRHDHAAVGVDHDTQAARPG